MNKSAKIVSKENVEMPKKGKNNYQEALKFYKLNGKSIKTIANSFQFRPTAKVNGKTKVIKPDNPSYEERLRELVISKWKDATTEYISVYNLRFTKYDVKKKKMVDVITKINVIGNRDSLYLNALSEFKRRVNEYERDYPENDSYRLDEEPLFTIPIKEGGSVKIESSVVGGQRKVSKKKMYMREAFSFLKFSDDKQEWNTNQGKCVFDYLIYKYKDVSGFKKALGKSRDEAEEFLNKLFMSFEEDELNPLEQGVSTQQLEKFCDTFGINMYALDKNEETIDYYKCKKTVGGRQSLIFIVFDNHFYPVEDKEERNRLTSKISHTGGGVVSNDVDKSKSKKKPKEPKLKEVIAPDNEAFENMKKEKSDYLSIQNQYALQYIINKDGEIPFPLSAKNVYISDATIQRIIYEDKVYLTHPINHYVKRYFDTTSIGYQGEEIYEVSNHIWNMMYPFPLSKAPFWSKPNKQVFDALNAPYVKWRTHIGRIGDIEPDRIIEAIENDEAVCMDICKCYCDALYNQQEKFLILRGKETIEKYDNKPLTLGLYFVETNDMTLFHQSNWYSKSIIEYAKEEHIEFKIVRQIRAVDEDWYWEKTEKDENGKVINKVELSNDKLFKNWCNSVIELTEQDEDYTLTKDVINMMTGIIGKTETLNKKVNIARNLDEIWDDWLVPEVKDNPSINVCFNKIEYNDEMVYIYGEEERVVNLTNGLPMYIQILDWSNINLHKLGKATGGEVVYRKTDCLVSIGGLIPTENMYKKNTSYEETFGTYRIEDKEKSIHMNFNLSMNQNRSVEIPPLEDDWIDYKQFKSSDDWYGIIKTALEKGGMLITGRAGTGKSYIVGRGIQEKLLPEENDARLAFTNKAARNIKGTTIHKAMRINTDGHTNTKSLQHLKNIPVFVVDEISMLNSFLWDKLMLLKETTGAIFILIGDHRQCPPIEEGVVPDYFVHPYAKRLVNYNRCELSKPQRYDMKLWKWLEDFYENDIIGPELSKKKIAFDDILYRKNICYFNDTRKIINQSCMTFYKKKKNYIELSLETFKCGDNKYADDAFVYVGLPVMAVKNNKDYEIINTEEFFVKEVSSSNSNMVLYREEDKTAELVVDFKDFHKYFVVNYAMTTYKSQGATIDGEINIFDWDKMRMDKRIGYTAISRGKNINNIFISEGL